MKLTVYIVCGLFWIFLLSGLSADAAILCPDSSRGLKVTGPEIKKKLSGQTIVTCEYYDGRRLAGIVKAHYYNNSEKSPECGASIFTSSKGASQTRRIFLSFVDKSLKDDYRESLWHNLGMKLMRISESNALPCDIDRKTIIGAGG